MDILEEMNSILNEDKYSNEKIYVDGMKNLDMSFRSLLGSIDKAGDVDLNSPVFVAWDKLTSAIHDIWLENSEE